MTVRRSIIAKKGSQDRNSEYRVQNCFLKRNAKNSSSNVLKQITTQRFSKVRATSLLIFLPPFFIYSVVMKNIFPIKKICMDGMDTRTRWHSKKVFYRYH